MRLLNVSISGKVQHQIFQNKHYITTDISKNTFKTLDFLLNVIEMKFKLKKLPENRQSPEAIQVQSDMSHMRMSLGHGADNTSVTASSYKCLFTHLCVVHRMCNLELIWIAQFFTPLACVVWEMKFVNNLLQIQPHLV